MKKKPRPALSIGCVYYMVKDMDRAVRFYSKTLGLPVVYRNGGHWAEVDAGSTRIGLHPTDGNVVQGGGTVSFYVDDLTGLFKRLAKKGAQVGPVHDTPRGKMAQVTDSEGNCLHFTEFAKLWVKEAKYPLPKKR
jgi:predicted enzyme related to lactoylglutathione lyase